MRTLGYMLSALALTAQGCYTETRVRRTVTRADGSTEVYENNSNGYNYNPNWTGHSENTFIGHTYNVNTPQSPFMSSATPGPFGQFTIR